MFQLAVDKPIMIPKENFYKGKKKLVEDDEDAPSTHYVKTKLVRLFKHKVALHQKREVTSRNCQALQSYYSLGAHCSNLEPEEKPPLKGVHHKTRCDYQITNHNPFVVNSPSSCTYKRKRDFIVVSECNFAFTVELPNSMFTFTHHVQQLLKR